MIGNALMIRTLVQQHQIDRLDVAIIFVIGANPRDADRIPFLYENLSNSSPIFITILIPVASVGHGSSAQRAQVG